MGLEEVGF